MAEIIKKQSLVANTTVYYTGGTNWSEDRSKAKTFLTPDDAIAHMANPDGTNGGYSNAVVETK